MKRALITGITGQDGSYLAELLLSKGYEVHGTVRRNSSVNTARIEHLYEGPEKSNRRLILHYADLSDSSVLCRILLKVQPDEIYNLGAQSHVKVSFEMPEYTADIAGMGVVRLLNAIVETETKAKFYQASSSEMYGKVLETPQRETTPFYPRSPYAFAKLMGYWATVNFREAHGLFACNGLLFNHESPRRGETFVTRKITKAIARILAGKQKELLLGNLDARRDWGHARDYVEAMWMMLQAKTPDDYVIATGETHSVREFLELAFNHVGLNWKDYVKSDQRYLRPTEVDILLGDASKAKRELGWKPKTTFPELVREMVESDLRQENLDPAKWMTTANRTPERQATVHPMRKATTETKSAKVYVAGHRGLVGKALTNQLKNEGFANLIARTSSELDLRNQDQVRQFFKENRPDYVYLVAGKVGGILANSNEPADFLYDNLMIAANVISAAAEFNTKKLLYLGSSCIYPRLAEQPIKESSLLTGPLEKTNEAYALAKIAGIKLCEHFRKQYQKNFISAMPCNLYGKNDNFHPENSHVIPGLLRRFHEAKAQGAKEVVVWGTGKALREFLNVEDLARALPFLMEKYNESETINIGSGAELTIHQLASTIAEVTGYSGKIVFDPSKPDGTPRKVLGVNKISQLGWKPSVSLKDGLHEAYTWALQNGVFTEKKKASA